LIQNKSKNFKVRRTAHCFSSFELGIEINETTASHLILNPPFCSNRCNEALASMLPRRLVQNLRFKVKTFMLLDWHFTHQLIQSFSPQSNIRCEDVTIFARKSSKTM